MFATGALNNYHGDSQKLEDTKCEVRKFRVRITPDGEQVIPDKTKRSAGEEIDSERKPAIEIKEFPSTQDRPKSYTTLTINSGHILAAFRHVVKSYPTIAADFLEPFEMESPFYMLYHYWEELVTYKNTHGDDEARMHINLLLNEIMEPSMGIGRNFCKAKERNGKVEFDSLWTIFRPGEMQICFENGYPWLLKLVKFSYEENHTDGKWLEVHCSYTDYDGVRVGSARKTFNIYQKQKFPSDDPANITDLEVYPRTREKTGDELENQLKERAKKFMAFTTKSHASYVRRYDGLAHSMRRRPSDFYHPNMANFSAVWEPYKETGRIIIDRKTFQEDYHFDQVQIKSSIEAKDELLCPPFVMGYSLAKKAWCRFYLGEIDDINWQDGFKSLEMERMQKDLLQALVSKHEFPHNPRDQMQQKGKGLVVLLHGAPRIREDTDSRMCC
jgi:hypothetical protein